MLDRARAAGVGLIVDVGADLGPGNRLRGRGGQDGEAEHRGDDRLGACIVGPERPDDPEDADIVDGNGWGLEAGVCNAFTKHFEAGASLKYVDLEDDSSTGVELYGQYKFGEWGIVGTLHLSNDGNELFVGPRISF